MKQFEQKIRSGNFTVTTELTPPKGIDLAQFFAKADALKGLVDAINITESPRARMAAEPKSVGHLLQDRGIEAIVQITARDRNRIAIQADLLGGYLLGIANFIFMTGDDPKNGDHPETKGVFDLTTIELLNAARSLRSGRDLSGNDLHGAPQMFLGSTINPGARGFRPRNRECAAKNRCGLAVLSIAGDLRHRLAGAVSGCGQTGRRSIAGGSHSAQDRKDGQVAEREGAGHSGSGRDPR